MNSKNEPATSRRNVLVGGVSIAAAAGLSAIAGKSTQANAASVSNRQPGDNLMNSITTKDGVQIYYKDWGNGQPIVFHHGWPLSSDDWDAQMMYFLVARLPCHCPRSTRSRSFVPNGDRQRNGHVRGRRRAAGRRTLICAMRFTSGTRPVAAKSPATSQSTGKDV